LSLPAVSALTTPLAGGHRSDKPDCGSTIYILEAVDWIHYDLPLDTFIIAFLFSMYAIALFGFRILDPIALSRQMVIAQMHEGVLVLDPQERVASLNPAAEQILQVQARLVNGQPIRELLPAYPEGPSREPGGTEIEFSLGTGQEVRHYTLAISELKDWRGLDAGCLLLLHDITEQKQVQAQLVKQQRGLAMLHEREQLARELHDSIGQVLSYMSMQAQAIRKRAHDGDLAAVDAQLARLASAQEAQGCPQSIPNLKSEPVEQLAFSAPTASRCLSGAVRHRHGYGDTSRGERGCFYAGNGGAAAARDPGSTDQRAQARSCELRAGLFRTSGRPGEDYRR
jgi:signal transduction histidine kinase